MTNSTEFDIGEDELGSDNIFRRSIEEAISNERSITIGEYNTFMSSIGALVPAYVSLITLTHSELGSSFAQFQNCFSQISKIRSSARSMRLTLF